MSKLNCHESAAPYAAAYFVKWNIVLKLLSILQIRRSRVMSLKTD